MSDVRIINTFPAFLEYWDKSKDESIDDQIKGWEKEHMASWPELLVIQIDNYTSQKLDWWQIAREKVFPHLQERMAAMKQAEKNLLELSESVYTKAEKALDFKSKVFFIIYVGIGCGAGWVTRYDNLPAILFGLENITESGWSSPKAIKGLVAHEVGHLVMQQWRTQNEKSTGSGPWWQLYEEGFAQHCEGLIINTDTRHQASDKNRDWLEWCNDHREWLANEFLKTVDTQKSVRPFFGSWFQVRGQSETGYYLGEEAIKDLVKSYTLKEIALLENVEVHLRPILERMRAHDKDQ